MSPPRKPFPYGGKCYFSVPMAVLTNTPYCLGLEVVSGLRFTGGGSSATANMNHIHIICKINESSKEFACQLNPDRIVILFSLSYTFCHLNATNAL